MFHGICIFSKGSLVRVQECHKAFFLKLMPQNSSTVVTDEERKLPIDVQEELILFPYQSTHTFKKY